MRRFPVHIKNIDGTQTACTTFQLWSGLTTNIAEAHLCPPYSAITRADLTNPTGYTADIYYNEPSLIDEIYVFLVHCDGFILPSSGVPCCGDTQPKRQGGYQVRAVKLFCPTPTPTPTTSRAIICTFEGGVATIISGALPGPTPTATPPAPTPTATPPALTPTTTPPTPTLTATTPSSCVTGDHIANGSCGTSDNGTFTLLSGYSTVITPGGFFFSGYGTRRAYAYLRDYSGTNIQQFTMTQVDSNSPTFSPTSYTITTPGTYNVYVEALDCAQNNGTGGSGTMSLSSGNCQVYTPTVTPTHTSASSSSGCVTMTQSTRNEQINCLGQGPYNNEITTVTATIDVASISDVIVRVNCTRTLCYGQMQSEYYDITIQAGQTSSQADISTIAYVDCGGQDPFCTVESIAIDTYTSQTNNYTICGPQ